MEREHFEGKIETYKEDKGYGFIRSEDFPRDLYFHRSQLINRIEKGEEVIFETRKTHDEHESLEAKRIRKVYRSSIGIPIVEGVKASIRDQVKDILYDLLPGIEIDTSREFNKIERDLDGRPGEQLCVETGPDDKIVYGKPAGKKKYWKFVLDRKPEKTEKFTIILKRIEDYYMILSAFYGPPAQPFPWDKNADVEASKKFWDRHALVLHPSIAVDPHSLTGYLPEELEEYFE